MGWLQGKLSGHGKHASVRVSKPIARTENLVIEDLDDEILIYDRLTAQAHCLNGPAAQVWRASDGDLSEESLAASLGLDADEVRFALVQLEDKNLLDLGPVVQVDGNGTTRRQFTITTAKAGAIAAAAPMIYSILAPTPAAAATPSVAQCLFYSAASCDGCRSICGCCCCCEGCSTATVPACKICLPTAMCSTTYFNSGCNGVAGVTGSCSSGPHCSATALNPPLTGTVCAPCDPLAPSGTAGACNPTPSQCCYPPCTSGHPTLVTVGCGSGGQPCNCTNEPSPC
jgi:hypothetical protein